MKLLKIVLLSGLIFSGLAGYGIYCFFFDMGRLPAGEFLKEETSPHGTYTLKAFIVDGGATTSYAIRGELVFNKSNKKSKNIYWNYREQNAEINWIDDDTVVINGRTLYVPQDKFDFRN